MPSGLVIRVGASWAVTGTRALFAPDLLRQTAPGLVRHPVDLRAARPRVGPGAALDATDGWARAALPPGRRVVAPLGMSAGCRALGHPGDLPARRGRSRFQTEANPSEMVRHKVRDVRQGGRESGLVMARCCHLLLSGGPQCRVVSHAPRRPCSFPASSYWPRCSSWWSGQGCPEGIAQRRCCVGLGVPVLRRP
jgi:hypothetical protein